MYKLTFTTRVLSLALLAVSQLSVAGFSQTLAFMQHSKPASAAPATAQLKTVLLEMQEHYGVEIVFEDHLVANRTISVRTLDFSQSVENNLNIILHPIQLKSKKIRKGTFVITEVAKQSFTLPETAKEKTETRASTENVPNGTPSSLTGFSAPEKAEEAPKRMVRGTVTDETGSGAHLRQHSAHHRADQPQIARTLPRPGYAGAGVPADRGGSGRGRILRATLH